MNTTTNANPTIEVAQQNNTLRGNTQSEEVSQPPVVEQPQQEHQVNTPEDPPTLPATTPHYPSSFNQNSRLPKLNLPTFSGNPLQWFTFWDSFQAAVHSNTTLGDIQKFSYLKAQLTGDAAKAISGFPFTNDNYTKAVQLLKERFGNASKVINAHMQSLLDLPNPKYELASLQLFYDTMESHIRGLESLGRSHSSYGDLLVPIVLGKLPQQIRTNLARDHNSPEWKFQQLRESILKEIRILEAGIHTSPIQRTPSFPAYTTAGSFFTQTHRKQRDYSPRKTVGHTSKQCTYCKGPHPTRNCSVVNDCQERWAIAKKDKLCFNCLGNHKSANCQSRFRCLKCRGKHHTTLCPNFESPLPPTLPAHPTAHPPPTLPAHPTAHPPPTPPAHPTSHQPLNPPIQQERLPVKPNAQQPRSTHATLVPSIHSPTVRHVSLLKTAVATVSSGQLFCDASILLDEGAQRSFITTSLANQLGIQLTQTEEISLSAFGAQTAAKRTLVNFLQTVTSTKDTEFDLERFWSLESLGTTPPSNTDKQHDFLEDYITTSITRNPDGSYTTKFPWKDNAPPLPDNYKACERRTRAMVRRLASAPDLLKSYGNIIQEQIKRGFIEKVEETTTTTKVHYIPHHPVHKESSTTPVRIVFDCSFHSSPNSPSLNDCLLTGPPFLNDMCTILLRFRTFPYGLSADIEKAFLHVGLDDNDRDFTRFLWLSDPMNPESVFNTFRFKTVLFGSTSSPFLLNATLRCHLQNYDQAVAHDIKNNIYVDNVISGCENETDTVQYYNEARSIMQNANFHLQSWASNSPSLQEVAAKDGTADSKPIVNIPGLKWNPSTDTLSYTPAKEYTPPPTITKRHVLQISSKIYDPVGLLSPVTVKAKLLIQELWQKELAWDKPLPLQLKTKWLHIAKALSDATNVTFQRKYFSQNPAQNSTTYIHVFVDTSPKAYGCIAYLTNGNQSSPIMAKSRVAPLKVLSLPQLELMAALIGTRLAKFLLDTLSSRYPNLKVKIWSDSEIVLYWINSNRKLKQFVMHRINEMKGLFPVSTWNHCPTDQNPADLLTRGITTSQLQLSSLWNNGPTWLLQETQWPVWNPLSTINLSLFETEVFESEVSETKANTTETPNTASSGSNQKQTNSVDIHLITDMSRYSSLEKLLMVTTYVYRFLQNIAKTEPRIEGPITPSEKHEALKVWIKNCQNRHYSKEIANLKSPSSTRLPLVRQLRLYLDTEGYLRCGGRIHNAPLSELTRFRT